MITCALGLFMLPPAQHEACLSGIRAILKPGGLLVATVWDDMALLGLGGASIGAALDTPAPALPYDPNSLGLGRADATLRAAGLSPEVGAHNALDVLPLCLGAHGSDAAFMLGLMPYAQALVELSSRDEHAGIFARVHGAFDEQVARAGFVDEQGAVVVPLAWRLLAARRPL